MNGRSLSYEEGTYDRIGEREDVLIVLITGSSSLYTVLLKHSHCIYLCYTCVKSIMDPNNAMEGIYSLVQ